MSDAGLAESAETLLPCCGPEPRSPFSQPAEAFSGDPKLWGPEALLLMQGMEMLGEGEG